MVRRLRRVRLLKWSLIADSNTEEPTNGRGPQKHNRPGIMFAEYSHVNLGVFDVTVVWEVCNSLRPNFRRSAGAGTGLFIVYLFVRDAKMYNVQSRASLEPRAKTPAIETPWHTQGTRVRDFVNAGNGAMVGEISSTRAVHLGLTSCCRLLVRHALSRPSWRDSVASTCAKLQTQCVPHVRSKVQQHRVHAPLRELSSLLFPRFCLSVAG